MSETLVTPAMFARLMSLPADHPERIAWNGRPEFESLRALYEQFETGSGAESGRDVRQALVDLERRFHDALEREPRMDAPEARQAARQGRVARSWWSALPRPAFAMAAVLIVAIGGVWLAARPRSSTLRGAADAPVILEPRRVAEDLEIRWTPVAGAESYRLSFVDDSMREIATVEALPGTRYTLKASALPPGLEHGNRVIVQVQPLRAGVTAGATATRSILVP